MRPPEVVELELDEVLEVPVVELADDLFSPRLRACKRGRCYLHLLSSSSSRAACALAPPSSANLLSSSMSKSILTQARTCSSAASNRSLISVRVHRIAQRAVVRSCAISSKLRHSDTVVHTSWCATRSNSRRHGAAKASSAVSAALASTSSGAERAAWKAAGQPAKLRPSRRRRSMASGRRPPLLRRTIDVRKRANDASSSSSASGRPLAACGVWSETA